MSVRRLDPKQPASFSFTPENRAWAKTVIARYPEGKQASAVIALLWRAQEQSGNWLPEPAIRYIADMLGMAQIRVLEVATFYTMFQLSPVGRKAHIQVCGTTPCMLRGSQDLISLCKKRVNAQAHRLSEDGDFSWEEVECLGACVNAPLVQVGKHLYEDLTTDDLDGIITAFARGDQPAPGPYVKRQFSAPMDGLTTLNTPGLYDAKPVRGGVDTAVQPAIALGVDEAGAGDVSTSTVGSASPAPSQSTTAVTSPPGQTLGAVSASTQAADAQSGASGQEASTSASTKVTPTLAAGAAAAVGAAIGAGSSAASDDSKADPSTLATQAQENADNTTASAGTDQTTAGGVASGTTAPGAAAVTDQTGATSATVDQDAGTIAGSAAAGGAGLFGGAGGVANTHKPELLGSPRGGRGDDLSLILGVGDKLEKELHAMGIWHFDQIAVWTPDNVNWFEAQFTGLNGMVKRGKWIKQAKKLAGGWRPDNQIGEKV